MRWAQLLSWKSIIALFIVAKLVGTVDDLLQKHNPQSSYEWLRFTLMALEATKKELGL